jgi:hypothetical protein
MAAIAHLRPLSAYRTTYLITCTTLLLLRLFICKSNIVRGNG